MLKVGDTLAMPSDVVVSTLNLQQMFSTEITDGLDIDHPTEMQSVCYTDGSKLGSGHTGSGIYFPDIQDSRENWISLGTSPTVFQAEVSAIHHAARLARENGDILGDREVIILSDSQAAIKALTRSKISSLCYDPVLKN